MTSPRTRYLLAMGIFPSLALAQAACGKAAVPDPSAGGHDAGDGPAATIDAAPAHAAVAEPADASPETSPTPSASRPAADAGSWVVEETPPPAPPTPTTPMRVAPYPRATCPSGLYCVHAVGQSDAGARAPAPYAECPALPRGGRPHSSFRADITKRERAAATPDACCYHWFEPCPGGRPLRSAEKVFVAEVVTRAGWSSARGAADDSLEAPTRARLAQHWRDEAAAEHASIASFNRFSLQLLALGAPRDLVRAAHRAALDEVRHAEDCYALAARYAGEPLGPGPLALPPGDVAVDPAIVARETLRDGCLGESLAAQCAAEAASVARDPAVASVLAGIAADEESHAELAWRTVAWLLAAHGAPVRSAVETFLAELPRREPGPVSRGADEAHGVLDRARRLAVQELAIREIVVPCAEALLVARGAVESSELAEGARELDAPRRASASIGG